MSAARARTRVAWSSSPRVKTADIAVTTAKKATTAHAQATYDGGKSVSDTVTAVTTTSAPRRRASHCPWRLGHIAPLRGEILRRDLGVELKSPPVVARHVQARIAPPELAGIG